MASTGGRASAEAVRARRHRLAEYIARRGTVSITDIVDTSGVSTMTAYRDIDALEAEGLVSRQRGLVSAAASRLSEVSAVLRLEQNAPEKADIARTAATLIKPNSSLLVDDSTTALWALRALGDLPLTVVTNSLLVARDLERNSNIRLIVTGGEYQPWAESLLGSATLDMIAGVRADHCLLSTSGYHDGGCYHPYDDVAQVKRAMVTSSESPILLLDHTKFTRSALHRFADVTEFSHVVVDTATSSEVLEDLDNRGVETHIATHAD